MRVMLSRCELKTCCFHPKLRGWNLVEICCHCFFYYIFSFSPTWSSQALESSAAEVPEELRKLWNDYMEERKAVKLIYWKLCKPHWPFYQLPVPSGSINAFLPVPWLPLSCCQIMHWSLHLWTNLLFFILQEGKNVVKNSGFTGKGVFFGLLALG